MFTQESVSSAWRLTQSVSEPTKTISVPSDEEAPRPAIERVRGLTAGS